MSESSYNTPQNEQSEKKSLIDSIYLKYTKSVLRALSSTEFYEYFMNELAGAHNEFQFSNRRMEKLLDFTWIDSIESALSSIQHIISSPRNIIREDELIVDVAHVKKSDSSVVRHLAQHGSSMIQNFDEETGDVRPNKLMQKLREDTVELYENRLVITVIENAYRFVRIRYDALFGAMSDEFGAKLKFSTDITGVTENIHMDMFMHIKERDDILSTDNKHREAFERIARLNRLFTAFMETPFVKSLAKATRIKGALMKTNVLKKNPYYKEIVKLYEFLQKYDDIGYAINVIEQTPEVNETLQTDMFHNVMFNYIVLKNYLDEDKGREVAVPAKGKKRTLRPKFIKEIIEELTEDYDLPDVEIRKVLIEELTKSDLMKEEAEERLRLVEEQERLKREEEERLRREKEEEEERLRIEKEKEEERIRKEKEAEEMRIKAERMRREMEDYRRGNIFKRELEALFGKINSRLETREEEEHLRLSQAEKQEFEDAARILEEQEQRKKEENERLKKRLEEEKAQALWEKQQEELRRKAEEEARLAEEQARKEKERLIAEEAQKQKDREQLKTQLAELELFMNNLESSIKYRRNYKGEDEENGEKTESGAAG